MKQELGHWRAQQVVWQNLCQQQQAVQRKIKKEGKGGDCDGGTHGV